jgi:hypothetical protein
VALRRRPPGFNPPNPLSVALRLRGLAAAGNIARNRNLEPSDAEPT